MENRAHALAAGLFVFLLGLATALGLWYLSGKRELSNYYMLETTRDVTGLNVEAQVRFRGIRAGKVESIEPDGQNRRLILVKISLDQNYRLTKQTVAKLGFQGITGLAFVQLEDDGTSEEYLDTSGDTLPRIAIRPSVIDMLGDKAGDIVSQISEVSLRLSGLMNEKNVQNISRTLENVADGSASFRQMPQLMTAMREVLSETNLRRMNSLLASLEKASGEAAPLAGEMRELVRSMTLLSQRLDQLAGQSGAETVPRVNALLRDLDSSTRQLTRLLETIEDSPQAFIFGHGPLAPGPGEGGATAGK